MTNLIPTNIRAPMADLEHTPGRECIERGCANEAQHEGQHRAGGWSPLWCLPCDETRIARISASLEKLAAGFGAPQEEQ